jgi:tetratricopeptide (TPR) repeat protein
MSELRLLLRRRPPATAAQPAPGSTERAADLYAAAISDSPTAAEALPEGERPFDLRLPTYEKSNLHWYLEQYIKRPIGGFVHRASQVESMLGYWAQALLPAALGAGADAIVAKLLDSASPRYLTIESDSSAILALPWELASAGGRSLAEIGVIVRRQPVPLDGHDHGPPARANCLRILLVVSRPDEMGYIDHCRTARLLDEVARLHPGKLEVELCRPATVTRFEAMLKQASDAGRPYGVVHFDGHGTYDPLNWRGELCFEGAPDADGIVALEVVSARTLGAILARYTRPTLLVFEACQTAQVTPTLMGDYSPMVGTLRDLKTWARTSSLKPNFENCADIADVMSPADLRANASFLTELDLGSMLNDQDLADVPLSRSATGAAIGAGVESIVGMSHNVHVDATACFMREFYAGLATGQSIGEAVDRGRLALKRSRVRRIPGARAGPDSIELEDWFVPQLYQAGEDRVLAPAGPGTVPEPATPPPLGRGRALLDAERRLLSRPALLVRGLAGSGKTTFAREIVYWMARSKEFPDGVYTVSAIDGVAQEISIGPFDATRSYSPASAEAPAVCGWAELRSWLSTHRALVVIDGIERLLVPDSAAEAEGAPGFRDLAGGSIEVPGFAGRLLMTTRLGRDNPVTAMGVETIDLEPLSPVEASELLDRKLIERGHAQALAALDAEVRLDMLNRLAGNPRAIETAGANWPDAAAAAGPEMIDGWIAAWAAADGAARDDGRLGVAAWPLATLPPPAYSMLALLRGLRGTAALDHIGRLQPAAAGQWREIFAAWTRIGLAEPAADEKHVHRLHPWLPYRLPAIVPDAAARAFAEPLALLYGTVFPEAVLVGPHHPQGLAQWLGGEWPTLRLRLAEALERHDTERALQTGLVLDDLLAAAGLDESRRRLLLNLETARSEPVTNELALEVRLRICDWAISHGQRNDAIALVAAALIEIDAGGCELGPSALAAGLVHLGDMLRGTGYIHASLLVYCRAAALWIEQVREFPDQRRYETFHLAECLGRLADVHGDEGRFAEAWNFASREFMAYCAGIGGGNLSLEPLVRFARILVRLRRFDAAESLFGGLLNDTSSLGDRSLAAWFECRGDLHAWRKKFDDAARMCTWALSIYEQRRDYASILACHAHMGAICVQTGRVPEAIGWYQSALEMALQRSDLLRARDLLIRHSGAVQTILNALRFADRADDYKQVYEKYRPYDREQTAKVEELKAYCAEADAWVRRAVKLDEDVSPSDIPKNFDAAAEILRRLAPREGGQSGTTAADLRLNEECAPHDQAASISSTVILLMVQNLLDGAGAAAV